MDARRAMRAASWALFGIAALALLVAAVFYSQDPSRRWGAFAAVMLLLPTAGLLLLAAGLRLTAAGGARSAWGRAILAGYAAASATTLVVGLFTDPHLLGHDEGLRVVSVLWHVLSGPVWWAMSDLPFLPFLAALAVGAAAWRWRRGAQPALP